MYVFLMGKMHWRFQFGIRGLGLSSVALPPVCDNISEFLFSLIITILLLTFSLIIPMSIYTLTKEILEMRLILNNIQLENTLHKVFMRH